MEESETSRCHKVPHVTMRSSTSLRQLTDVITSRWLEPCVVVNSKAVGLQWHSYSYLPGLQITHSVKSW